MTRSERVWAWVGCLGRHFADRAAAGRALSAQLTAYVARSKTLVLALAQGGVPVGFEVARALGVPLDVALVRRLGVPGEEDLALGAVAEGGACVLNDDLATALAFSPARLEPIVARAAAEIARQARAYRGDRPAPDLRGRTVILVDDGLATGATMRAAIAAAGEQAPAQLIVAAPVAARRAVARLRPQVDDVVVTVIPEVFGAIGLWYDRFAPVGDDEVRRLLDQPGDPRAAERCFGVSDARALADQARGDPECR